MRNPVDDPNESWCEWPVRSYFHGETYRACGRSGHGRNLRLCWQHRDAARAEVVNDMYIHPDLRFSRMLGDWVRSTLPSEYDTPQEAEERAQARKFAVSVLRDLVEYGGPDRLDPDLRDVLAPWVESAIEKRLAQTWGAA